MAAENCGNDAPSELDSCILEREKFRAWLDGEGIGKGAIEALTLIARGTQNLLIRFRRDHREYVLRRPSLNPRGEAAKTLAREARVLGVLGALGSTNVPHSRLVGVCTDPTIGPEFYII